MGNHSFIVLVLVLVFFFSPLSDSTVAADMWGVALEQDQAESPGSDGASPYLSPAFLVCELGKFRAELAPVI